MFAKLTGFRQAFYSDIGRKKRKTKSGESGPASGHRPIDNQTKKAKMRRLVARLQRAHAGGGAAAGLQDSEDEAANFSDSDDDEDEDSLRQRLWDLTNDEEVLANLSDDEQDELLQELADVFDDCWMPSNDHATEEDLEWEEEAAEDDVHVRKAENRILEA